MTVSDTTSPVLFELRDSGVAVVTLNRPDRMNAWGGGLAGAFYRCIDRAARDPDVRVVVLTGNGRMTAAGLQQQGTDVETFADLDAVATQLISEFGQP